MYGMVDDIDIKVLPSRGQEYVEIEKSHLNAVDTTFLSLNSLFPSQYHTQRVFLIHIMVRKSPRTEYKHGVLSFINSWSIMPNLVIVRLMPLFGQSGSSFFPCLSIL